MRRGSTSITDISLPSRPTLPRQSTSDPERLAALAELTMARQTPGLVLPSLGDAPSSFSYTDGTDTAIKLARTLVHLGIGSSDLWKRHNCNPALFIRDSLNKWLSDLGADKLQEYVSIDFAVVDHLESVESTKDDSRLFAFLETSDGCGAIFLGQILTALDVFDVTNAEYFVERWRESVEMDMEPDGEEKGIPFEQSFEQYCKAEEITFPDPHASMPEFLKDISISKESKRLKRSLVLLTQHRTGPFASMIEPLLTIANIKHTNPASDVDGELRDEWDDVPLPNWVVAFEPDDPIMQAFDEESQSMHEASHSPTWIAAFDPADAKAVSAVLQYVKNFVQVNQQIVKIQQYGEKWSKSHAGRNRTEFDDNLRAA
jgi:hypothetical protein